MMYCERCNIDFSEGLRYCKWCGQTLVERRRNTSELHFCPNCSAAVQPKWAFCKVCGVQLASVPRQPPSTVCPQCGTKSDSGALHCLICGHHLQPPGDVASMEAPSTSIIALCPNCSERIDPGSVYCKGCGAALYEQATPFGESAIICASCQSFNPVGSETCRVCGAALTVASATEADYSPTQVITEKESSTLPDLADHLPIRQSSEYQKPTVERQGPPAHVTEERATPPPPPEFNSGAYTLTLDSQGHDAFHPPAGEAARDALPVAAKPPAPPAHTKGGETSVLPGVAGSKFEQPQPTTALHMNRDTGPVEGESEGREAAPSSADLNRPPAPPTRIDTDGLAAHRDTPPAHDTFTFVSDVDATASEGTIALGSGDTPPTFEDDARPAAPFVLRDEVPPSQLAARPPSQSPTAPVTPSADTDHVVAEATQIITNVAPQTETIADAARRFERPPQATLPIDQIAPPPFNQGAAPPYPPAPAPVVAAPAAPRKKSSALWVVAIIGLFVIGIAVGAAWFLFKKKPAEPVATVTPTATPTEPAKPAEPARPTAPVAPEGMVLVAAGTYTVGRDDDSDLEKPRYTITLPAYFIDRTEVTNEAYKKFVDEAGHKPPSNWRGKDYPTGRANYPVTGITWQDAADYAAWAGKRLPTEVEWEAAARGPEGSRYPWGNEWLPGQANIGVKEGEAAKDNQYPPQVMEVGGYPQGASPAGALDMIGNVWEWTADELKLYPGNSQTLDEIAKKQKLNLDASIIYRVIRGGAFDGSAQNDASYRGFVDGRRAFPKTGFRCVKEAK